MEAVLSAGIVLAGIVVLFLASSIKIVQEYERGVIFRLGRCVGAKGPGVFFVLPVIDKITKINLQIIAAPVASQAVITKDNVTVTVDAVAYFQVIDPAASVVRIRDWYTASQLVAQTTLRAIVGRHEISAALPRIPGRHINRHTRSELTDARPVRRRRSAVRRDLVYVTRSPGRRTPGQRRCDQTHDDD